ncbi:MAG: ATP-binding cassette domain-containing protein, partial [Planctomycetes bacterium]|nr:ATP-binding cassette domain-containing protein [Planctomycetota bacterium]
HGEIVGFLGPNGAGKTTTMRVLTCFIPPTVGSVRIANLDARRQSMAIRRITGYLAENNPLYLEMRVVEYLEFRAHIKGVPRREREHAVGAAVEKCGLQEVRRRIIGHLSKGFRQRVGLADAIVHNPELVILDEPTIGLDPNQVRQVRDVIRELGERRTVLLSTHILSEVEKMCGRVLIINRGRLVADGTPGSIVNKLTVTGRVRLDVRGPGDEIKRILEAEPNVKLVIWMRKPEVESFLIESKNGGDLRPDIFRCAARHDWDVLEVGLERVSLEDAFVELTSGTAVATESKARNTSRTAADMAAASAEKPPEKAP